MPSRSAADNSTATNSTVTMTFHIDPVLKQEVTEIVKDFGLNLTAVTRAFYKQIVRDGSIPLSLRYDVRGIDDPGAMLGVVTPSPADANVVINAIEASPTDTISSTSESASAVSVTTASDAADVNVADASSPVTNPAIISSTDKEVLIG